MQRIAKCALYENKNRNKSMAALHDELITAIKSLRAFLIRKIWSTASIEKSHLVTDTFDVSHLLYLIQNESQYSEVWKYFLSFYAQRDVQYLNHTEHKNIYALIRHLKSLEENINVDSASFITIFKELNIHPASDAKINEYLTNNVSLNDEPFEEIIVTDAPVIISTELSTDKNIRSLPTQDLQELLLSINSSGQLPNNAGQIIAIYEKCLQETYQDAPSYLNATSDNEKIKTIIQITDFFVISEQTNLYTVTNNFHDDLTARYILQAQHHYYNAVKRLKETAKNDTKFLKDVSDFVNAAKSQLLFTPSETLLSELNKFSDAQSFELSVSLLSNIELELASIETQEHINSIDVVTPNTEEVTESTSQSQSSNQKHPYFLMGSLEPTMKESPKYDDELIQELRESFKEEAELEIFPLIDNAVAALKNKPYKEADILDLRRAFHTLKGSGYTASFPILGEMGWQVERVINGVRDNHYPFSEAILYHALDGYDAIKMRLEDPTYQDDELQRLTYQAQYLIDHDGIIEPNTTQIIEVETSPVIKEEIVYTSFDDLPEDFQSPYHVQGSSETVFSETSTLDADLITQLKASLFDEAKLELLPEINRISLNLLSDTASHQDIETIKRVFHTLKGSALLVGLNVLGEISSTIENITDTIITGKYKLTPEITYHIAETYQYLKKFFNNKDTANEAHRLLYQGNILKENDLIIPQTLIEIQAENNKHKDANTLAETTLLERRQAIFENIQSTIEQSAFNILDQKLSEEKLDLTDEELGQKLIIAFTKCESRTYSALKRYSHDIGLCLLHPNFSNTHPLNRLLISSYHRHLLLFRAHGLTPHDERLILWGKVLTIVLAIIKKTQVDESVIYEYIDELQKPILDIEQVNTPINDQAKTIQEEVDPELMQAFIEEAQEVLEYSDELIQAWQKELYNPNSDKISELRRQMHTLKGGARMVGKDGLGQLSHALESLLEPNYITLFDSDPTRFEVLQRALDHLQILLESDHKYLDKEGFNLLSALYLLLGYENPPELTEEGIVTGESTATEVTEKAATAAQSELSTLKISPVQLNEISEKVSENSILTTQYNNSVSNITAILSELARTTQHLNMVARNIEIETEAQMVSRHAKAIQNKKEFDPLELDQFSELQHLARSISESIEDLNTFHRHIGSYVEQMSTSLAKFSNNQSLISDTLTDIGTVSFSNIIPRLRRIIRQVSKTNNKQVELNAIGVDTQVERVVLEQMTAPFEHMIRNSIVHGIETPEERLAAGKSAHGTITLKVSKVGSDLLIEISDDGKGFNVEKIRDKAIETGLIDEQTAIDDNELATILMLPGFSTAKQLSQDAGRGVGLDVLAKALTILKGEANISFIPNEGVTFTISIPATLMIIQSIIVDAGGQTYAIPLDNIIGVTQEKDVIFDGKHTQFSYHNDIYQAYDLSTIYSSKNALSHKNKIYLLFEINGKSIAIGAESIVAQLEVIMHPLNPQISNIPGITGSAVTPDGETIFTVDIQAFTQFITSKKINKTHSIPTHEKNIDEPADIPLIMVIDDSITMRRVSQRMLERSGYKVITAKDGVDALEMLESYHPDLIMLDIEMPRMDGFEVLTYLRSTEKFMKTPVMMVTSRSGEKHRNRALEIGANEYCGKPYQEKYVLQMIQQLLNNTESSDKSEDTI